ncbi:hypothetical protein E2C01_099140 [Portunus trituberculatus]|uniref:Uncharacterized protein n=1 Tax=Portunus trituberculatus TaxID=210409 RepID=A0A5B7K8T9_PORTR|nr:hypothetical protein [Portunus trituberculatus]
MTSPYRCHTLYSRVEETNAFLDTHKSQRKIDMAATPSPPSLPPIVPGTHSLAHSLLTVRELKLHSLSPSLSLSLSLAQLAGVSEWVRRPLSASPGTLTVSLGIECIEGRSDTHCHY